MTDQAKPVVSVVVATLDASDLLRRCLAALFAQDYSPLEVIVVDNGSTEDIEGLVRGEFPRAHLVRLAENRGFAGGYNAGMRAASGKYVAVINNDAVASPGWIRFLVEAAEADKTIGAVAPLVMDGNRPGCLDSCGEGIAFDGMSRQLLRGVPLKDAVLPGEILFPSASACMYRAEALAETGLYDERFFAVAEDTDLGLRLRRAGWRAVAAPAAVVEHGYSMTTGRASLKKLFWVERNHYWVAAKNFPLVLLLLVPFATLWRFMVQAYLMASGIGGLREFAREDGFAAVVTTVLRAHLAAVAGLPGILRDRFSWRPPRRLSGFQMAKLIMRHRMSIYEVLAGPKNARK